MLLTSQQTLGRMKLQYRPRQPKTKVAPYGAAKTAKGCVGKMSALAGFYATRRSHIIDMIDIVVGNIIRDLRCRALHSLMMMTRIQFVTGLYLM